VPVANTVSFARADVVLAGYTASKGAVAAMTRTFALDVAKKGIVANSIAPGCKSAFPYMALSRLMCVGSFEDGYAG
jgi:NAD(P)-dependent dehydrogenase (short-subunit alcohol dehydrogenase family)